MSGMRASLSDRYWRAVVERDAGFTGRFVYGVASTRVYCLPTCPARRPRREGVLFFANPDEAESAGFRACKRCHPRGDAEDNGVALVERLCEYIEERLEDEGPVKLAELSEHVGVSPYHLQRTFKRVTGISPRHYVEARRLERLKIELKEETSVTAALYDTGYSSSSRLYERTPRQLGMTPTVYKKGGAGMNIGYTVVDSPLGRLLVAATEKGVCSVCLGDVDQDLEDALRKEYPAARINKDGVVLDAWVRAILRYLDGYEPNLELPLDLQATAFQWRVWQELMAIPYGSTRSYSQVARAIGRPSATRAVAHACAANRVALLIPCHRVVKQDGSLGGYKWGLERKKRLLAQERSG